MNNLIDEYGIPHFKPRYFKSGGSSDRQEYIDRINEWALANPTRVFDDDFKQQRQYLSDDTWNYLVGHLKPEARDKYWTQGKIPRRIYDKYVSQELRDKYEQVGNTFGNVVTTGISFTPIGMAATAGLDIIQNTPARVLLGQEPLEMTKENWGNLAASTALAGMGFVGRIGKGLKAGYKAFRTAGKTADKTTDVAKTTNAVKKSTKPATEKAVEEAVEETVQQVNPSGIPEYKGKRVGLNRAWSRKHVEKRWAKQYYEQIQDRVKEEVQKIIDEFNSVFDDSEKLTAFKEKYKIKSKHNSDYISKQLKLARDKGDLKELDKLMGGAKRPKYTSKDMSPALAELARLEEKADGMIYPELPKKRRNWMIVGDVAKIGGAAGLGLWGIDHLGEAAGLYNIEEDGRFGRFGGNPNQFKKVQ